MCVTVRGLCEKAAQSGSGKSVFLGKGGWSSGGWEGGLRRTDRYAETGREGYRKGRCFNRPA